MDIEREAAPRSGGRAARARVPSSLDPSPRMLGARPGFSGDESPAMASVNGAQGTGIPSPTSTFEAPRCETGWKSLIP